MIWKIFFYSTLICLIEFSYTIILNNKEEIEKYKKISGLFNYVFLLLLISIIPPFSSLMAMAIIKDYFAKFYNYVLSLLQN
jgi:hypothetical protein